MAHDVFISYSSKDKNVADAACALLEARGIRCWMAPRDILPGSEWGAAIIGAIGSAKVMVLIYTSSSNASPQVRREVERAVARGLHVIPFRMEDVPMSPALEYFISSPHWLDAINPPMERHLDHLARIIKAVLDAQNAGGAPAFAASPTNESWAHGPPPSAFAQQSTQPAPTAQPAAVGMPAAAPSRKGLLIVGGVLVILLIAVGAILFAMRGNKPEPVAKGPEPANITITPPEKTREPDTQRVEPPPPPITPTLPIPPVVPKQASAQEVSTFWDLVAQGSPRIPQLQSALDDHSDLANTKNKDGNTPLFEAAKSGQPRLVTLLLSSGADRTILSAGNNTPLHGAALGGVTEQSVIDALVPGNVNARNADGNTPVHLAVQSGNSDTIRLLADARADINLPDKYGRTPLQLAMLLQDPAKSRAAALALIGAGAKLDTPDKRGNTPVHLAAATGDMPLLNAMLEKGAKLNTLGEGGRMPLHAAVAAGRTDAVKAILARQPPLDAADNAGNTPLHLAATLKEPAIAEMLLRGGAKVTTSTKEKQTALHVAAAAGNMPLVDLLIANGGAEVILNGKPPTPAEVAEKAGKKEVVELLRQRAVPMMIQAAIHSRGPAPAQLLDTIRKKPELVESIGPDNQNAVHLCAAWGNDAFASQLIAINPEWAKKFSTNDESPLHLAATYKQAKVAAVLLKAGASVIATNSVRETPLHCAARAGAADVTKLLLDVGADPSAENKEGETPAAVATVAEIKKTLSAAEKEAEPVRDFWRSADLESHRFAMTGPGLTEPVKIRFHDGNQFSLEGNIGGGFKSYDGTYAKGPLSLTINSPEGQIFPGIPGTTYSGKVELASADGEFSVKVGNAEIRFARP